ncbi:hypothetical protein JZ751_012981 [Albula glossodonta]|uniref:Uncharacterized protein n=1 Tax=Albula glossodonta TaxID=121402 RepID=A0A8T2N194_9TELE|nr:hypothetical protein JZ751_012981 [Albula glossodonta]
MVTVGAVRRKRGICDPRGLGHGAQQVSRKVCREDEKQPGQRQEVGEETEKLFVILILLISQRQPQPF